jgi:hypothetical protein
MANESVENVADWARNATRALDSEYPERPRKPVKTSSESNKDFGTRVDDYEYQVGRWRVATEEYCRKQAAINVAFKERLLNALGISDHPKADKLYAKAREYGHSSGFYEVAYYAEELAELLA